MLEEVCDTWLAYVHDVAFPDSPPEFCTRLDTALLRITGPFDCHCAQAGRHYDETTPAQVRDEVNYAYAMHALSELEDAADEDN